MEYKNHKITTITTISISLVYIYFLNGFDEDLYEHLFKNTLLRTLGQRVARRAHLLVCVKVCS